MNDDKTGKEMFKQKQIIFIFLLNKSLSTVQGRITWKKSINRHHLYLHIKTIDMFWENIRFLLEFYIKISQIYYPMIALYTYRCINHNWL